MAGAAAAPCRSPRWGLYRASDGTHTALAAAGPLNPVELADVPRHAGKARAAGAASGGGVFWIGNGTIPEIRRVSAGRPLRAELAGLTGQNGDYVVTGFSELPLLPASRRCC